MNVRAATVAKTGYVMVEQRYYSVPYKFIGKRVKLLYNRTRVEAYSGHKLIAMHERSYDDKQRYVQDKQHLASWHRYPAERNPEKFICDAGLIDVAVAAYIEKVLARNEYPEKNYRACQGIINLGKRVGATRLVNACRRADSFGVYNYGIIERILLSKADHIPLEQPGQYPATQSGMPDHDNIRGEDYYQ